MAHPENMSDPHADCEPPSAATSNDVAHVHRSSPTARDCAREILDVMPIVSQAIRYEMRAGSATELSVPQFRTLNFVRRQPGASLSAAAEHIGLTLSSMSILVNGLVERGLVERVVSSQDRRRVELRLTSEGTRILGGILESTEAGLSQMVGNLSAVQRRLVFDALEVLRPLFLPRGQASRRTPDPDTRMLQAER